MLIKDFARLSPRAAELYANEYGYDLLALYLRNRKLMIRVNVRLGSHAK